MATQFRIFWLITLCFFLASCGAYRPAVMPGYGETSDTVPGGGGDGIESGDRVRVTLLAGTTIEGAYASRDSTLLAIDEWVGAQDQIRRVVPISEVESIDAYDAPSGAPIAVLLLSVAAVAVFAVVMGDLKSDLGFDSN